MARKTVKVEVPSNSPDAMLTLSEKLYAYHLSLGNASPLKGLPMSTLNTKTTTAKPKRVQAKALQSQVDDLMQEVRNDIGIDEGQTSETKDTIFNIIVRSKTVLLGVNKGNEEELNKAGFKVVISSFAPTGRKKKT